jgi:TPR repeat protein
MIGSITPVARQLDADDGYPSTALSASKLHKAVPIAITYPRPLNERLQALAGIDVDVTSVEPALTIRPRRSPRVRFMPNVEQDLSTNIWPEVDTAFHIEYAASFGAGSHGHAGSDPESSTAGLPFDPEASDLAPQAHMQELVRDFHRRQRNANLLVAGSVGAACVLTVIGVVVVASFATPSPRSNNAPPLKHSTSVAWQPPQLALLPIVARQAMNRGNKGEPLLIPARAAAEDTAESLLDDATLRANGEPSSRATVILVQGGRPLALAPLLPMRQARYLLLRGLPEQARLSAGHRSASGTWIVKDDQIGDLTLLVDEAPSRPTASGDYPVDVYLLGTSKTPQARQRLVLRVEPTASPFGTASVTTSWPATLLDLALMSLAPNAKAVAAAPTPLLARARGLLGEGDIAGARLLLTHLAEAGDGEAAYELARTFDAQALNELGARGMGSDPTRARGWYEQASENGNLQATERLKIFASLAD